MAKLQTNEVIKNSHLRDVCSERQRGVKNSHLRDVCSERQRGVKNVTYRFTLLPLLLAIVICLAALMPSTPANALARIDITRTNIAAVPLALQTFSAGQSGGGDYYINAINDLVASDLESSGLFNILDKDSYIEETKDVKVMPTFVSWRQINASALVLIDVVHSSDRAVSVEFSIWDVYSEKALIVKKLSTSGKNWRRIAHKIADEVYKKFTGEQGYFDTKVTYVAVDGRGRNKRRRLAVMDHDGANQTYLTKGDSIVLTPRFSKDADQIIYFTYEDQRRPMVKLFDLRTNKSSPLREFHGMSYAPRYAPDGKSVLLSVEKGGVSNIYSYDMESMAMRQLTECSSICTSPSPSPDQSRIVFNSDMGGSRALYVMDFNGRNVRKISGGEGRYTAPVWSPKGNLIAFTKMVPGEGFYIGIMRPDGSGEKIISQGYLVEGPAWAPNGRALIFEKQGSDGETKLYKVDIVSRKEQQIDTEHDATDANWSGLLD